MDKLKSRKLWVATIGTFVIAIVELVGVTDPVTTPALAAVIVAYLAAQGLIDRGEVRDKAIIKENEHLVHTIERIGATSQEEDDGYELYQG